MVQSQKNLKNPVNDWKRNGKRNQKKVDKKCSFTSEQYASSIYKGSRKLTIHYIVLTWLCMTFICFPTWKVFLLIRCRISLDKLIESCHMCLFSRRNSPSLRTSSQILAFHILFLLGKLEVHKTKCFSQGPLGNPLILKTSL